MTTAASVEHWTIEDAIRMRAQYLAETQPYFDALAKIVAVKRIKRVLISKTDVVIEYEEDSVQEQWLKQEIEVINRRYGIGQEQQ